VDPLTPFLSSELERRREGGGRKGVEVGESGGSRLHLIASR